jgi:hypothetical protein
VVALGLAVRGGEVSQTVARALDRVLDAAAAGVGEGDAPGRGG